MPAVTVADVLALPRIALPLAAAGTERPVVSVTNAPSGFEGEGFPVRRAFAGVDLALLDPFIHMDQMGEVEYGPGEPKGTSWHPHRGFETATYIIDGTFEHQDNAGGGGVITNGDTQWMTAGAGIQHIERPSEALVMSGGTFHGVQLWVNLPKAKKWESPRYQDIGAGRATLLTTPDGGALVRVIAGDVAGHRGPGITHTPMAFVHATLSPGAELVLPWQPDYNALVYALAGKGSLGSARRPFRMGQLAVFGKGDFVTVAASEKQDGRAPNLDVLIIGGQPIREPLAWYGPFVMNTRQEVLQAIDDFHAGRLGTIPASSLRGLNRSPAGPDVGLTGRARGRAGYGDTVAEPRVLAMVLAGGEGKRLYPLTADRAKPAVPFGGHYRMIDFALSNLANGGYLRIVVLTQYKSHSLGLHISRTWRLSTLLDTYVTPVPAQMRQGPRWFAGSADAIFQNLNLLTDDRPDYVCVFGADHIYRMDPRQMVEQHIATGAGVTVGAIRVPRAETASFGILEAGAGTTISGFLEKPRDAEGLPDAPDQVFASMGNYVFTTSTLIEAVTQDSDDDESHHDLGGDIIPMLVKAGQAHFYDFADNEVPGVTERERGYWRDVGTLDAYYDAHMDLVSVHPVFNLYNRWWPIHTAAPQLPPAKFVHEAGERVGRAMNSLVCAGAIVSGGTVRGSVLSPGVLCHDHSLVEDSVLLDDVVVGAGAIVRRAILDKNVVVPPGARIGVDHDSDADLYNVSQNGIVVIGKGRPVFGPGGRP